MHSSMYGMKSVEPLRLVWENQQNFAVQSIHPNSSNQPNHKQMSSGFNLLWACLQPYLFGALLSRDECYDNIMTHAYKANLPWGSCAGKSRSSKDSRSQSEGAEGTNCEDDAATLGDQPLRMSSLQDDEDLLGLMNEY